MNIDQWISCISEAYKEAGETFSPAKKEILLGELPQDSPNTDQVTRLGIEAGVIPKPIETQDESLNDVVDKTKELITRYFFKKVPLGETFGSITRVEQKFRHSLETNYDISSGPFIDMAKTYWTYQLEVKDLFPEHHNLVLAQVLLQVNFEIGGLFFPFPGSIILWAGGRKETQRELLEEYTTGMDVNAFLSNNPILGTSKGRIAETVFNERVWVRCPNPNCLRFLKIPNTVKVLKVTCPKCRTSFRFPVRDHQWLNHLRPDIHPELYKVDELENLRRLYNIPHKFFAMRILSSPWATRRIQENIYAQSREKMPKASEKEILKTVFASRVFLPTPFGYKMTEKEINEAMESINSLEDLTAYFIERDEAEEPAPPDTFGIGARIDEILLK
jgi:hypothetical protein